MVKGFRDAYIAGLFDGDGTCGFSINENKDNSIRFSPIFQIEVNVLKSYVGGLFDAEGNFQAKVEVWKEKRVTFKNRIHIGQRYSDDSVKLFKNIKKFLKEQGIKSSVYVYDKGYFTPTVRLSISKLEYVKKFVKMIYPYTVLKRPQLEIFLFKIFPLLNKGNKEWRGSNQYIHRTTKREPLLIIKIMKYIDILNSYKSMKGSNRKYSADYFRKKYGYKKK